MDGFDPMSSRCQNAFTPYTCQRLSGAFVSGTGREAVQSKAGGLSQMAPIALPRAGTSPLAPRGDFWRTRESSRTSLSRASLILGWGHFGKKRVT